MSIGGPGPMHAFNAQSIAARYFPEQTPPVPSKTPSDPSANPTKPAEPLGPSVPRPGHDVDAAADRVMQAGVRPLIRDNYEARMDRFAAEMSKGNDAFRAALLSKVLDRDPGAFKSWLHADRLNWMVNDKDISAAERDAITGGMLAALRQDCRLQGGKLDADFVRQIQDSTLTAAYIRAQNLDDKGGFERALKAFSGLQPRDVGRFSGSPETRDVMQNFSLAVQRHQDWYESQTVDTFVPTKGENIEVKAPIEFSKEQLSAMRAAFQSNDGLVTHGELLLAFPDRQERNEQITKQYFEMSQPMSDIVGADNASWLTFGMYASDEAGRSIDGTFGTELGDLAGDPKYWLSIGNTKLGSDIGPVFHHFIETFSDGKNRDMSFDKFWQSLEQKWGGRGISYLDGHNDKNLDMKNAFKAYHEAMQLRDKEATATSRLQILSLTDKRAGLMLYSNVLVGLQEQKLIQTEIEQGLNSPLGVNPLGAGRHWIDVHLPGANGTRRVDTNVTQSATPYRVNLGPEDTLTTADGRKIELGDAIHERLEMLDGNPHNTDEYELKNSAAGHWESYSDRMGTIFHLFANEQRNTEIQVNPREVFDSRATALNNDPSTIG